MSKRIVIPGLITLVGLIVAGAMFTLSPKAKRAPAKQMVPLVDVLNVAPTPHAVVVMASGRVSAAQEIVLQPQVSGQIVSVSDLLVPGGVVKKGDILAQIDPRDYELAVEQQRGLVRAAELELERELARKKIAKKEWELLGQGQEGSPLALRDSQLAVAQLNVEAQQSALKRAQLALSRTTLRAPFNAKVLAENVDIGQFVAPQSQVARLIGADLLRVSVSVPVERLAQIEFVKDGFNATVIQHLSGGQTIQRRGRVTHQLGELDTMTRRATVVVEVPQLADDAEALPLLPGAYVDVHIEGRTVADVYRLPSQAVSSDDTVLLLDEQGRIRIESVSRGWEDRKAVYILEPKWDGPQRVVTSTLRNAMVGMEIKIANETTAATEQPFAEATTGP